MNNFKDDNGGWREFASTTSGTTSGTGYVDFNDTGAISFYTSTSGDGNFWSMQIPDVNWMPYKYVEYDPLWHKKFAAIKFQMDTMWD